MRRAVSRAAVVAAGASVALGLLPAHPASAAPRAVTIEGRGFGHGRGMSQWGARGMAQRGASWRAILGHYYRGTRVVRRPPGERIRVLVASSSAIVVTSDRRFTIMWSDGVEIGVNDARRRFVRVRFSQGHHVVESSASPSGPWRRDTRSRRAVVFTRGRSPLEVVMSWGSSRAYRGTIEVRRTAGHSLHAINHLPLEEYLFGVVPREVPSTWPAASLRAQAVAARSYAVALMQRWRGRPYDICPTTACQVYGGLGSRPRPGAPLASLERPSTTTAVLATARHVLQWGSEVVMAEYSSSSGGTTASGHKPYLRPVHDPADRISPNHTWSVRLDASSIERAFRGIGRLRAITIGARDGSGVWGGRVRSLRIVGSRGVVESSGGTFASRMGLRSRWYRIQMPGVVYRFARNFGMRARGEAVAELQRRLRDNRAYRGTITSVFDARTRDALARYQRSRRIRATGYLGPITRARLNAEAWP